MRDLSVNQLLEYPDEGKIERILWVDPAMSGLYAIDIHAPTAMPVFREAEEMERMRETGEWRVTEADPWLAFLADEGIPETYRSKRDRAWAMIRALIFDQPAIFQSVSRSRTVQAAMAETGATKQTIYRLLRRYWQRGMTPNTLLPD